MKITRLQLPGRAAVGALLLSILFGSQIFATDVLVPAGAVWKYLDNGSNLEDAWRGLSYDDDNWTVGPAELGYGDASDGRPEATVISFGPNSQNKPITYYFRKTFNLPGNPTYTNLQVRVMRDDGAVVYVNDTEVVRSNMPDGPIDYSTRASISVSGQNEATFFEYEIPPSVLVDGANIVAVEIHQYAPDSSDVSFDLELVGDAVITPPAPPATTPQVSRGPYLQLLTSTSVTIRWRTDLACDSRVRFGESALTLGSSAGSTAQVIDHEVRLSGLTPNTRYYYSVGTSTSILVTSHDAGFFTAPAAGAVQPVRVWVAGDTGDADGDARPVRNSYYNFTGDRYTDVWLMLGDNAYPYGTDADYQKALYNVYPTLLRQTALWSTIGNHDTAEVLPAPPTLPYFQMFTFPTSGQAGGFPSGTENYYSFDYANIHFVCLDAMASDRSVNGPMVQWLRSDLSGNALPWVIAFWHHPVFSKGSHDSDMETPSIEMRGNILPVLEEYGVDLVLNGHSHAYERTFLLDGHYGPSTSLATSMIKNAGSGRPEDTGPYVKTNGVPHQGTVYVVSGASSGTRGGPLDHPTSFITVVEPSSMVLDVNGSRLDAKLIGTNQAILDSFTIVKVANNPPVVSLTNPTNQTQLIAPANVTIEASASDVDGSVSKVEFFAGNSRIGETTSSPYTLSWQNVGSGTYLLKAKATDNIGASTVSTGINIVVDAAPTIVLNHPSDGEFFTAPASLLLQADASDPDGSVSKVEFFANDTKLGETLNSPYTFGWANAPAGVYAITAKATDNLGVSSTSSSMTIRLNSPPTVGLSAPTNNAVFAAPADITLEATPNDPDSAIAKVEFYSGGIKLGEISSSPYVLSWTNAPAGGYSVTAVAIDEWGASGASSPVAITVDTPPAVTITNPVNSAIFTAPAVVILQADAGDTDGSIASVEFFAGGTKIGESLTRPYAFTWTNVSSGTYLLTAKATDNLGISTPSDGITVVVDQAPVVTFTSPAGQTLLVAPGGVVIQATASDADGTVSKVEFLANGTKIGESLAEPYSFSWQNIPAGVYLLTTKATDNLGISTTSGSITVVIDQAPLVALIGPADPTLLVAPGSVLLQATASDADGTVSKVEFFANGSKIGESLAEPFTLSWQGIQPGTYLLTAKAIDNRGVSTVTSAATLVVNSAPSVSMTAPVGDVFTAPASVLLRASASDTDGAIAKVEFLADGVKLGESSFSPFSFPWTNVSAGTYSITARATDNLGASTLSAGLLVSVNAPPPPAHETATPALTVLISPQSFWKYMDLGLDQGTTWSSTNFNDNGWATGAAPLGYGHANEATILRFARKGSTSRFPTTYFRRSFTNDGSHSDLVLRLLRKHGAVVFLNGVEVFRSNMPAGTVSYQTFANRALDGTDENAFYETHISPTLLITGTNVVAVELHQWATNGLDIRFDLELIAFGGTVSGSQFSPTLCSAGSSWRYFDLGTDQGTTWRTTNFNDNVWASGLAPLGYGHANEATILRFAKKGQSSRFITTYFRRNFTANGAYSDVTLRLIRKHGAVIYLNGTEIWRSNMPSGTINYLTAGNRGLDGTDENTFYETHIDPSLIVSGTNVLAVELHQWATNGLDIRFDAEVLGIPTSAVGP